MDFRTLTVQLLFTEDIEYNCITDTGIGLGKALSWAHK